MKLNTILNRWMIVLLALVAITFTACDDDDDEGSGQVILEAYGPSPALRGSELTFIGRNMDQVTAVILPEEIEITNIEVVSNEKIKVTIPQDAEVGYVRLVTPDGEITSKTLLAYTEPISISGISPNPVKAGETLSIEGDYLNLIQKVVFTEEVTVKCANFTTWKRAKIELIVPKTAQTGIITLADTATIPVELEWETILQVTLPSVTSVAQLDDKKPGDVISINGTDLDLVEYVVLAGKDSIDFTVNGTELSFTLPSGTTDGEINMLAFSGVNVLIANVTMAVPTELIASPATDIRAGDIITISGVNMDLVTTVIFPGVTDEASPLSIETDKITVMMPDVAISGDLTLNTASGNTTTVIIATLKPEVTSYTPSPVSAGNNVTITGTNLDLVASVTFTGDQTVDVTPSSATSLTVTVPVDAETGELTLTMANGETVVCSSLTIEKPEFCYIPTLPGPETEINAGEILSIEVKNGNVLTDVLVNGSSTQFILQGSMLYVLIPDNAGGNTELTLVSSNGKVTYEIDVIGSSTVETIIYQGPVSLTWSEGGRAIIPISAFDGVSEGSVMKIYFEQTENWGQAQINNGSWAVIPFAELNNDGYLKTDLYNDKSVSEQELLLTKDILDNITNNAAYDNGIIIQGENWIISKVSLIPLEIIWEGETPLGNWKKSIELSSGLFADVSEGQTLYLSIKDLDASVTYWQVALKKGSDWSDIKVVNLESGATSLEFEITSDILSEMQSSGINFMGYYCTITMVGIR